ncbi:hypothetical protein [Nocardia asteroides]|uniref:hypothetical protein n=1 Tax=Nocardia asteroides TaxID=1824 RepID=UPI001E479049|nr:hypothetical protein [Nocardia asteroides]UGT54228.1 hypothetical protein LTT85_26845 [Nocardia asteroides]
MYFRASTPAHDYAAEGLTFERVDAVLAPILPRVRQFAATASAGFDEDVRDPWGSYEDDAYCYAADASCFIKLDGEPPLIQRIWFQAETEDPARLDQLRRAIIAIDGLVPSVIVDYWLDCTGSVADAEFLDRYLRMLLRDGDT